MNDPIEFSHKGGVARIRLNRPASLNAIDRDMAGQLLTVCRGLAGMPGLRVIVLSGEGKAFMAGGDLARFHADPPNAPRTAAEIIGPLHQALAILAALPQPVLGSLHGAVAGAGVSLALACDLCIAADNTQFNLAYTRIGASPDGSASWSLPRIVGLRKAMELVMLSETIDAPEALRLGMINRIAPRDQLTQATDDLAQRLAAGPTFAYGQVKHLLRASFDRSLEQQLDAEQQAFCACAGSADFVEGLAAFFEKRPARFGAY